MWKRSNKETLVCVLLIEEAVTSYNFDLNWKNQIQSWKSLAPTTKSHDKIQLELI